MTRDTLSSDAPRVTILSQVRRKARHAYPCCVCGATIAAGITYIRTATVEDGGAPETSRYHADWKACWEAIGR